MRPFKLLAAALVMGAAALLVPAAGASAQQSATAPQLSPAPAAGQSMVIGSLHIIDVDQPLPSVVDINRGEVLVFARKMPFVGSNVTVSARQMACFQCITMRPVNLFASPQGYSLIMSASSQVTGWEFFDIAHTVVAPGAQPTTQTIKVVVH